jgi:hypothetical protein
LPHRFSFNPLLKTQQLVAIVVVLFFTHGKLSGKLSGKGSKFIQNPTISDWMARDFSGLLGKELGIYTMIIFLFL